MAAASRIRVRAMLSSGFWTPARLRAVVKSIGWTSAFKIEGGDTGLRAIPRTARSGVVSRGSGSGAVRSGATDGLSSSGPGGRGDTVCAPGGIAENQRPEYGHRSSKDDLPDPLHSRLLIPAE